MGLIFMALIFTTSCSGNIDSPLNGISPAKPDNIINGYKQTASNSTGNASDGEKQAASGNIDYSYNGISPAKVNNVPDGYMRIADVRQKYGSVITVLPFEAMICVLDVDNNNLYQTGISDSDFVVEYKNDLYVNMAKINELLPEAQKTTVAANQLHYIGDPVEIININRPISVITVKNVSYANSYNGAGINNNEWVCIIELRIDGFKSDAEHIWNYFGYAEGSDGQIFKDVLKIDNPNQMAFRLPSGEKAKYLFVTSKFSNQTRKIDISESNNS